MRRYTVEDFRALIDAPSPNGCRPWLGWLNPQGYGQIKWQGRQWYAHRLAYHLEGFPLDSSLVLDHVCHTNDLSCAGGRGCLHRRCCEPTHLELVTQSENASRSRILVCKHGHDLTEPANLYFRPDNGYRACAPCRAARNAARFQVVSA